MRLQTHDKKDTMNNLIQLSSLLIGSSEAACELEQKKSAKLLVLSDTHGDYELTESIIRAFGVDCDALIFTGDGARDIIMCVQNAFTDDALRDALPPIIALARGNGDADTYYMETTDENAVTVPIQVPERQSFKVAGRTVFFVHGHRHGVDYGSDTLVATARTMDADMVFFGHTHRPYREDAEGSLLLNPGSPTAPRGGAERTFAVVTFPCAQERYAVEFFAVKEALFGSYRFEEARI